jgi:hypothetical protein
MTQTSILTGTASQSCSQQYHCKMLLLDPMIPGGSWRHSLQHQQLPLQHPSLPTTAGWRELLSHTATPTGLLLQMVSMH